MQSSELFFQAADCGGYHNRLTGEPVAHKCSTLAPAQLPQEAAATARKANPVPPAVVACACEINEKPASEEEEGPAEPPVSRAFPDREAPTEPEVKPMSVPPVEESSTTSPPSVPRRANPAPVPMAGPAVDFSQGTVSLQDIAMASLQRSELQTTIFQPNPKKCPCGGHAGKCTCGDGRAANPNGARQANRGNLSAIDGGLSRLSAQDRGQSRPSAQDRGQSASAKMRELGRRGSPERNMLLRAKWIARHGSANVPSERELEGMFEPKLGMTYGQAIDREVAKYDAFQQKLARHRALGGSGRQESEYQRAANPAALPAAAAPALPPAPPPVAAAAKPTAAKPTTVFIDASVLRSAAKSLSPDPTSALDKLAKSTGPVALSLLIEVKAQLSKTTKSPDLVKAMLLDVNAFLKAPEQFQAKPQRASNPAVLPAKSETSKANKPGKPTTVAVNPAHRQAAQALAPQPTSALHELATGRGPVSLDLLRRVDKQIQASGYKGQQGNIAKALQSDIQSFLKAPEQFQSQKN